MWIDYEHEQEHDYEEAVDASGRLSIPMTRTIKASLLFFVLSLCTAAIVVTDHDRLDVLPPAPLEFPGQGRALSKPPSKKTTVVRPPLLVMDGPALKRNCHS